MASWQLPALCFTVLFGVGVFLAGAFPWRVAAAQEPCFPAVFVFGDSYSDTGNGVLSAYPPYNRSTELPFGETFPGWPTRRYSDGRLFVDFLARYFGLPPLNPFLDSSANFSRGVNYAVAGATVLNKSFLSSYGMDVVDLDDSLEVQMQWHLLLKARGSTCKTAGLNAFANGLYVFSFLGKDYGYAMDNYTPAQVSSEFVPLVIAKIREAAEVLYVNGARYFLFISSVPSGCLPVELVAFPNATEDEFGCLSDVNALAYTHNSELRKLVYELRGAHPTARFLFADYYGSYMLVLANRGTYGLTNVFDACCGAGLEYAHNINPLSHCNNFTTTNVPQSLCPNPSEYLSWDGTHLTDRMNSIMFDLTVRSGAYLDPSTGLSNCNSENFNHNTI